ncbi:MAG: 50S ribosomal protein L14e [Candidatus Aenigmarchaeota archaeon]|nr:50S ribosomal protein L14e [Candidatus Aenigmarchaeota archaeon]
MLEVGRVCIKTVGREGGKYCVVVKKIDKTFVEVTGPKILTRVKRRKVNISHLEPLPYLLNIKEGAGDEEVIEAYKKANLIAKLSLKLPSAAKLKARKEK